MLRLPHSGHSGSPLLGIGRWGSSHLGDGRSCSSHLGVGHLGSSHYRCCGQQWFPVSLFVNPVHDLGHPLHCFHQPWISSADPFSLDLGIQLDLIQEDIQVAVPQQMSPLCSQPQRVLESLSQPSYLSIFFTGAGTGCFRRRPLLPFFLLRASSCSSSWNTKLPPPNKHHASCTCSNCFHFVFTFSFVSSLA
ncbi:UNVERIFIED_CONTAM: hypothetical protein FKN15_068299 [Acipenser sinensis]